MYELDNGLCMSMKKEFSDISGFFKFWISFGYVFMCVCIFADVDFTYFCEGDYISF